MFLNKVFIFSLEFEGRSFPIIQLPIDQHWFGRIGDTLSPEMLSSVMSLVQPANLLVVNCSLWGSSGVSFECVKFKDIW